MGSDQQFSAGIHRVFISSMSQDLLAHRQAIHAIPERMGQFAVDMAQFGEQGTRGADALRDGASPRAGVTGASLLPETANQSSNDREAVLAGGGHQRSQ